MLQGKKYWVRVTHLTILNLGFESFDFAVQLLDPLPALSLELCFSRVNGLELGEEVAESVQFTETELKSLITPYQHQRLNRYSGTAMI